ncbi:MAG: hypothetical protein J1F31_02910 [Erysipelotrichales bacterium]|nr:hypothetical protein [Erysipelotrichales bacterium]
MEKLRNNLGKIIVTMGLVAAIFLCMTLFQMFDNTSSIDYVGLIAVLLTIASSVLLIVFGFKNGKIEKYLLIPFCLYLGALVLTDLNNIINKPLWSMAFSLLVSLSIVAFYVLHLVMKKSVFKDVLVALLIALSISHLVVLFSIVNITSISFLILPALFALCLVLQKKEEISNE